MQFHRVTLDACSEASGTVVVIDVLRAFSTAAYAFDQGAESITLASTVEEALDLHKAMPGSLVMGEVSGLPVPGFDLSNSPSEIVEQDLTGRQLIQRTSNGVQGLVRCGQAEHLLCGSLVCASATACFLQGLDSDVITFVETGVGLDGSGDEDAACADFLEALLRGDRSDPVPYIQRVLVSFHGRIFADPAHPEYPAADLEYCTAVDRFNFAMPVEKEGDLLVMRAKKSGKQNL
jgi:2-phosphosulfolactate phosphatase